MSHNRYLIAFNPFWLVTTSYPVFLQVIQDNGHIEWPSRSWDNSEPPRRLSYRHIAREKSTMAENNGVVILFRVFIRISLLETDLRYTVACEKSVKYHLTSVKTHLKTKASSPKINFKFSFATVFLACGVAISSFAVFNLLSRVCRGVMKIICYKIHGAQIQANFAKAR